MIYQKKMNMEFELDEFSDITTGNEKPQINHHLLEQTTMHITELYDKYSHDLYMTSKIYHYISQQLPSLLVNVYETRQKNAQRMETHMVEQEKFITDFLHGSKSSRYYYYPSNEMFYAYDGLYYQQCKEDDVLYDIVSSITKTHNHTVQNWKHKTKVTVLRKIKDNVLTKSVPESETIQRVLRLLYPSIFSRKSEAKYFLTIIGDNIQKKHFDLFHFIRPKAKNFLKEFQEQMFLMLQVNCTQTFKLKCHEKHELDLASCRLVPILETVQSEYIWKQMLQTNIIDIFCVACHYSNRYGSSDEYLQNLIEHDSSKYALTIKNNTMEQLFQQFIQEYLIMVDESREDELVHLIPESSPQDNYFIQSTIHTWKHNVSQNTHTSWKHIFYLWKDFLRIHVYPQNLFYGQIKTFMTTRFFSKYIEETDCFQGISSSHLPVIQKFLKFWNETIFEDEGDNILLEMDEIAQLFRIWVTNNGNMKTKREKYWLDETKMIHILNYYKPNIEIQNEKCIWNIKCMLWDKDVDIQNAIEQLREIHKEDESVTCSLHDAYLFYGSFQYNECKNEKRLMVNKSYFQNTVRRMYGNYIDVHDVFTPPFFSLK